MKKFVLTGCLLFNSYWLHAHAEHDKARYVAPTGVDTGYCENVEKPCKTIGYAASRANKGDKVLVASGQYHLKDVNELFYLTSELVPVYGGYSQTDHYKSANTKTNPTYISGVPAQYHQQLNGKGFATITDGKAMDKSSLSAFNAKLKKFEALSESQSDLVCSGGEAGEFSCNNMDLVAHIPLESFPSEPWSANDVWGHVDLNTGTEYAIIGLRNGTAVVNLSDPSNPEVVGVAEGLTASWRDIKVYQYFDNTEGRWMAYAYVSTDGAADSIAVIDLNSLPNAITRLADTSGDTSLHNIYISNVNYSTGVAINNETPLLHSMGSNRNGGAHRSYSLANPTSITPVYQPTEATRDDYTHDGTSFMVNDSRASTQCGRSGGKCDVFVDFNENEMRLWDQTDGDLLRELGQGHYFNASEADSHYVHSGWWTEDQRTIYLHDELDELNLDTNTALYIFNVDDLTAPEYKGKWSGPTLAIDHNGFVRGNRYYMSNYERGITVLDITNPESPVEVGYFDTFPVSDSNAFNGAWGVYPFLPSGLILASDINSGLYILRDNTKDVEQGQLQFSQLSLVANEGTAADIVIHRINGESGEISVDYRTLHGNADNSDFTEQTGTLTWSNGETDAKAITIAIQNDSLDNELEETFFVELFNVQGGATLYSPAAAKVTIPGVTAVSAIAFTADSTEVIEHLNANNGETLVEIPVRRYAPFDNESSVNIEIDVEQTDASENQDFRLLTTELNWTAGDNSDKMLQVVIIDDDLSESSEKITLTLLGNSTSRIVENSQFEIRIVDNENNQAPTATSQDYEGLTLENFALKNQVTITDDDASLSYLWQQTSGNNVTIINPTSLDATVTITNAGSYEFSLTVTDPLNQSAMTSFTVTTQMDTSVTSDSSSSGGFSINWHILTVCTLLILMRRRKEQIGDNVTVKH